MGSSGSREPVSKGRLTTSNSAATMPTIVEEGDGTIAEDNDEEELFYSYKTDSFSGVFSHSNKYSSYLTAAQKHQQVKGGIPQVNSTPVVYSRPNRKLSLKEAERFESIKRSLKALYATEEAWMIPLQWLPDTRLEPEQYFVDLELEELNRGGNNLTRKSKTTLEELLAPNQIGSNGPPKRILVRGEAGFGKSTLCSKICYDWAIEKRGNIASKFELIIMYRLRELNEERSLEEEMVDFCHSNAPTSKHKVEMTVETLTSKADKILLILDGYDEANEEQKRMVHDILGSSKGDFQSAFMSSTILVTSRYVDNPNFLRLFQRHVRITGMSETNRKSLIRKLTRGGLESHRIADSLKSFDQAFLSELSPFLLYLICYLHGEKQQDAQVETPFKMLAAVTLFLSERCNQREQLGLDQKEINETLHRMGEFCFDILKSSRMIFRKSELEAIFPDQKRFDLVVNCGILKPPASFKKDYDKVFLEPIHKLFVEYLATYFLNNHFSTKCVNSDERLRFLSHVSKKFGGRLTFYSPSSAEMFLVVETWVNNIEFVVSFGQMEKDKYKRLANGEFCFTSDRGIHQTFGNNQWGRVTMEFRKMEEDKGFVGASDIIPYWIRGREFVVSLLEKMIHQDWAILVFRQDNFKPDDTKEISVEFELIEDESIVWSSTLSLQTQFNPETTVNVDQKGPLVFRKLILKLHLTDLKRDYLWCKRFTAFTLRCSRVMPAIGDKVKSGQFLHAFMASLETTKRYKWCRFDITPKDFYRAFVIDCLIKRGRVKLNLLQGKATNEIIRINQFMDRKDTFTNKLDFDFFDDDGQRLFLVVKN